MISIFFERTDARAGGVGSAHSGSGNQVGIRHTQNRALSDMVGRERAENTSGGSDQALREFQPKAENGA